MKMGALGHAWHSFKHSGELREKKVPYSGDKYQAYPGHEKKRRTYIAMTSIHFVFMIPIIW